MGGSSKRVTVGYRYYMSLHMGVCRGPVDEIVQINVGDVRAFPVPDGDSEKTSGLMAIARGPNNTGVRQFESGAYSTVSASEINTIEGGGTGRIDAPELFGGDKKEGGISGTLVTLMGGTAQVVPTWIKSLLGGLVPEFRGVLSFFFDGLITSMNPYPKKWAFRVRRTERGWDGSVWQPDYATIWLRGNTIKAMNGAHILYECLTNRDWGRGMSRSLLKEANWLAAATTLFNENFGLCLKYNRQSDLSSFIQSILDHIGGSLYPDRVTGQVSLDLLRGDYDVASLPIFTFASGLISTEEDDTATQDDLVNEVIVKWTDPIEGKDRSARVQDLASNQTMGAPNSTTTTLAGLPTSGLALRVAQRNLKAGANALKRFKVVLDRRASNMVTGSVFRISAPDRNIVNLVLRAGKITDTADGKITVSAIIDVFGMPSSSFISSQPSEWVPLSRSPLVADVRLVREATYAEIVMDRGPADAQTMDPLSGGIVTFAAKPSAMSQGYKVRSTSVGSGVYNGGAGTFTSVVTLNASVGALTTEIPFRDAIDFGLASVGDMAVFPNEICKITAIDTTAQTITLLRGCVDTVPVPQAAGTRIFIVSTGIGSDDTEYTSGEQVSVQLLTFTSSAELAGSLAPSNVVTIVGRQGRPYPPGNVRVNGNPFTNNHNAASMVITWAHRNRITLQDKLIGHTSGSTSLEAGVTYRIRVYDGNTNNLVRTIPNIAGTTFTYTSAMATEDGVSNPWFELESVRDGLASFTRYRFGATIS